MSWTFAHISDSHVRPDTPAHSQLFVDHLAEIAAAECAFVLHTGDLLDEPGAWHARAFRAMASLLPVPLYCVPGNHDVYNPPMGGVEAPWWARLEVDEERLAAYHSRFGPSWYTFHHEGTSLVAMNSLILNSGLPQEREQWVWLADTFAALAAQRPERIVLFTHLPLFVRDPEERLDPGDFRNRYLVVAPPARDRLLDLVRRTHVDAVLTGHAHLPWELSHTWPDGFTARFITTGSSGPVSTMAADHFHLPLSAEQGVGYHEHRVEAGGLQSRYLRHEQRPMSAAWSLGPGWTAWFPRGQEPALEDGLSWTARDYQPRGEAWSAWEAGAGGRLSWRDGAACTVRQIVDVQDDDAGVYLELDTEQACKVTVNGELLYDVQALRHRPPAWRSAGGTVGLDSALLCLALNPGLDRRRSRPMRKGRNVVGLWLGGEALPDMAADPPEPVVSLAYRKPDPGRRAQLREGDA